MNKNEFNKRMKAIEQEMQQKNRLGDLNRARSISVGTTGGGTTELMMRGNDSYMWYVMQPVEVIELIHQLSANVGCHIHIQPRKDFSAWREWKVDESMYAGPCFPPWVNDMSPHVDTGRKLPPPEEQPGIPLKLEKEKSAVAIDKKVNKNSTKRTKKSS